MEKHEIVAQVVRAVAQVQEASGRSSGGIGVSTRPVRDVEGFDSLSGVEATVMLSESLGVHVPEGHNPFVSKDGKLALSVGEIADTLCTYMGAKGIAE